MENNERKIRNYKVYTDQNGYVTGYGATLLNDYDFKGQMSDYPDATEGWTKFINGQFVEDEQKKSEILIYRNKINRINELKQKLNETDYIYNSIREGGRTEEYYADVIENRKAWRKEIQDLEEELGI